jgi:hypothetical protein
MVTLTPVDPVCAATGPAPVPLQTTLVALCGADELHAALTVPVNAHEKTTAPQMPKSTAFFIVSVSSDDQWLIKIDLFLCLTKCFNYYSHVRSDERQASPHYAPRLFGHYFRKHRGESNCKVTFSRGKRRQQRFAVSRRVALPNGITSLLGKSANGNRYCEVV